MNSTKISYIILNLGSQVDQQGIFFQLKLFKCLILVQQFRIILFESLEKHYMQIFGRRCLRHFNESYRYSVYFLKGNDPRPLNLAQQNEIYSFLHNEKFNSSCLLYNPEESINKIKNWKKSLPWIRPHYAVKSNPCEQILQDLMSRGSGLDCASRAQIEAVLKLGATNKDIVYSNSIKNQEDLIWAESKGIQATTADSIDELKKIRHYAPNMRILWRIAIQEEAEDNLATPFSGKFGDDLNSIEEIHERMKQISEMGVNLKGIHFHCGSGHHGSSGFGKAVQFARSCIEVGRHYGHDMDLLDIGGGFPSGDLSETTINALKPTEKDPLNYQVIAEPGRHFSGNSFYLLTRVLGKRIKSGKPCYHLNESLYHSFNCNLMDGVSFENEISQFYSKIGNDSEPSGVFEQTNSTLFGMTCDGMDIIAKNLAVPTDIEVGDWLCLAGMGAYTYGCRSNFNGMSSTTKIINWPAVIGSQRLERQKAPNVV